MDPIYLDNAASTRIAPEALAAMTEVLRTAWGNPSASHPQGALARRHIAEARDRLAGTLGDPGQAIGQIVFTSGCTEADALGVVGAAKARPAGGAIALSALEHPAVAATTAMLAEAGAPVVVLPVRRRRAARPRRRARPDRSGHRGGRDRPGAERDRRGAARRRARRARADRGPGGPRPRRRRAGARHVPIDVRRARSRFDRVRAHKVHGPRGIGALWVVHGARLAPLWRGGGQQGGLRAGHRGRARRRRLRARRRANAVAGLARRGARWGAMRDALGRGARRSGVTWREVAAGAPRSPHIVAIALHKVSASALRNVVASRGVYMSTGSACAERDSKPSATLAAVGVGPDWGVARLSFGARHDAGRGRDRGGDPRDRGRGSRRSSAADMSSRTTADLTSGLRCSRGTSSADRAREARVEVLVRVVRSARRA